MDYAKSKNQKIIIEIDKEDTDTINVEYYIDGKLQDMDYAFCHPDDEFVFSIGAKLAFDRIMKKVEKNEEDYAIPKVGDLIRRTDVCKTLAGKEYEVLAVDEKGNVCVNHNGVLLVVYRACYVKAGHKEEPKPKTAKKDTDFKVGDRVRFRCWADMKEEFGYDKRLKAIPCACHFTDEMLDLCGVEATVDELGDGKRVALKDFSYCEKTKLFSKFFSTDMLEKV